MNRIKQLFLTVTLLVCSFAGNAFNVNGIYYDITSSTDLTVEVTYGPGDYIGMNEYYIGDVVIPPTITYNGIPIE